MKTTWGRTGLSPQDVHPSEDGVIARNKLYKRSGYHLIGFVGVPLLVALYLILQLHKLPSSSVSYSLLNAIVSILFNFGSSALLKVASFFISMLGIPKSLPMNER